MLAESVVARRMHRWMALSSLALIAVTWRLWTPQFEFPQVPAWEFLCNAPGWLDWCCLVGLLAGLMTIVWGSSETVSRCASSMVIVSLVSLFCLDQHRFQPWAYQLLLVTLIGLCRRQSWQLTLSRWLLISIYFYSGLSKLDHEFAVGLGQQMLGALWSLFGQDIEQWSATARLALAMGFPIVEIAMAIALAIPESRRIAAWFAIAMHGALVLILGPLGLQHGPSVLIWNVQFVFIVALLFVVKHDADPLREEVYLGVGQRLRTYARQTWDVACTFIVIAVCLLPLGERVDIWDHWPSWALYAPHSSRVQVYVARSKVDQLPSELVSFMDLADEGDGAVNLDWILVPIDRWSLRVLGVPIYPQARFQLGVARHISNRIDAEFGIRVVIQKSAHRMTGKRIATTLEYGRHFEEASKQYWFNTNPRRFTE